MSRETSAKEWFNKAESDRDTAKYLLAGGKYDDCAFYCQQAAEKLLKAIVVQQTNQRPPYSHDLLTLARKIIDLELDETIIEALSKLDGYYAGSRYPLDTVDPGTFVEALAKEAVQTMEEIFAWFSARFTFGNT
jgi:HEPN domain-containing protein